MLETAPELTFRIDQNGDKNFPLTGEGNPLGVETADGVTRRAAIRRLNVLDLTLETFGGIRSLPKELQSPFARQRLAGLLWERRKLTRELNFGYDTKVESSRAPKMERGFVPTGKEALSGAAQRKLKKQNPQKLSS